MTLFRLEDSRYNLKVLAEDCSKAPKNDASVFLDKLEARLPHPEHTLNLRELVVAVYNAELFMLPVDGNAGRSRLLNNLGVALSGLGRREEALSVTLEAADNYRKLAEKNPQAFLPDLARSPGTCGHSSSDPGMPC
jgi:hypothetical protein